MSKGDAPSYLIFDVDFERGGSPPSTAETSARRSDIAAPPPRQPHCPVGRRWDYPDDDDGDELDAAALRELGGERLDEPEAEGAKERRSIAPKPHRIPVRKTGTAVWKAPRVPVLKTQRPPVSFSPRDFLAV